MKLLSSRFNFNSALSSIINRVQDGADRECLIDYSEPNRDQKLINYAFEIQDIVKEKVFLSVKIPYGSRSKRIELLFLHTDHAIFCKFTDAKRVDEAALELQAIISVARQSFARIKIMGLIFFPYSDKTPVTHKFAAEQLPDVRFIDVMNLRAGEFCGLFGESKSRS